ncbi:MULTISPECIES: hypothetical protein [Paraburkholderia]|uniref:Uncharacterized protein n=1 Tax=Paraburkholderia podalyriae TaxID=1938811 RepID=A0ABR7Q2C0_9BURK|nr:hypothetical protein [Paraburkholderia podalyriae]MBC8752684.1 hypothetical protein [Paraburkholderia podalyriae]
MAGKLNFNAALSGLDFIANGEFTTDDAAEQRVYSLRLIERLLDQLDAQGRDASESEDTNFRHAIAYYGAGQSKLAVDYAFRAANAGDDPIFGEIESPDRTLTLRAALDAASR